MNPASLVAHDASVVVRPDRSLRGTEKLRAALAIFVVPVAGRVALDWSARS
jgi:predicted rRNA methylase YqxC with S4 and FtsJ domains